MVIIALCTRALQIQRLEGSRPCRQAPMRFEWGRGMSAVGRKVCQRFSVALSEAGTRSMVRFDESDRSGRLQPPSLVCEMRQTFPVDDQGYKDDEIWNDSSWCAPDGLRWRTEQKLSGGDRFDDAHLSFTDRATPAGLIRGCRRWWSSVLG